ncbi:MAG: hypothetical protein ABII88_11695 [Candidatus Omnitrophota bacterium]
MCGINLQGVVPGTVESEAPDVKTSANIKKEEKTKSIVLIFKNIIEWGRVIVYLFLLFFVVPLIFVTVFNWYDSLVVKSLSLNDFLEQLPKNSYVPVVEFYKGMIVWLRDLVLALSLKKEGAF